MSIVFDNIVFSLQRAGGISRVWSKITQPYCNDDRIIFIESDRWKNNIYHHDIQFTHTVDDHRLPIPISRYINFNRNFFEDGYIFHSSYFRINEASGCSNVTTVHDLIYEKFSKGLGAALHLRQKEIALRKSDCIVCVSEHTRKDLIEHYPFCADKRVIVIPNGVEGFIKSSTISEKIQRLDIGSYFLYVGHRGGCKGFSLVHDAIDLLESTLQCVVVGDPFNNNELKKIVERGHEKKIVNVGKLSDADLNDLYSHASFFFFPSLYEGFGIPPLEAMMAGCPVLTSNRSSVPEVVGSAGILFDPSDLGTLKNGLIRVLQVDVRDKLIALGTERARIFSWKSVVDRYAALYAELC